MKNQEQQEQGAPIIEQEQQEQQEDNTWTHPITGEVFEYVMIAY